MGKTILSARQSDFLELVQKEPWLTKNFFLGGGTALSEFYLRHRQSEDLDFFSEKEIGERSIRAFLRKIAPKLGFEDFQRTEFWGLEMYLLRFDKKETLKVDFSYYPFPPFERWTFFGKLRVASIYDIAVDKLQSIFGKSRPRDYIDLYFIFKEKGYKLEKILKDIRNKFDLSYDPGSLISQFLRVRDFKNQDFPKMLKPFKRKEMEDFFLGLAKSLEGEIFVE
ncbi:MAG: nucleotidyl transferase AbiEii/AbiGii toxin family protein [Patescibacteria group bacterium]